jgi:phenylpyruvate tautomerase PptA (4-oxalocrotonate tautomerase family)
MPLVKITVSGPRQRAEETLAQARDIVVQVTGKPESATMAIIDYADIIMGAQPVGGAFVEVRGLGTFAPEVNAEISRRMCAMLEKLQGIKPDNIYLNFMGFERHNWGKQDGTY